MIVSILARLFGRAPLIFCYRSNKFQVGFNPRPALRPGAAKTRRTSKGYVMFQSSPGSSAGRRRGVFQVFRCAICFNPRPALRPGAARRTVRTCATRYQFQSSPGSSAGRRGVAIGTAGEMRKFQSSPGSSAGRRNQEWCNSHASFEVSILARLFGRAPQYNYNSFIQQKILL